MPSIASALPAPSILLVEDDPDLAELLRELFLQVGWAVRLERNGSAALQSLKQARPDVMVTDCMMPQMGGRELLERMRKIPELATLPVVLMSGADAQLEGGSHARQMTLRKPFDPAKLIDLVRKALGSS